MKLSKEKIIAAILAVVALLGVVDLTVLEKSNLKGVLETVQQLMDTGSSVAPVSTETAPKAE